MGFVERGATLGVFNNFCLVDKKSKFEGINGPIITSDSDK